MKRILFYGYVSDYSVKAFIEKLDEHEQAGDELHLQINSGGGDVFAGWGLATEARQSKAIKKITVHGNASSMLALCLCFYENVEAIPQSKFILHRASSYGEDRPEVKKILADINKDAKKAFDDKLDTAKLYEIGGVTEERFFSLDEPAVDIVLNAKQAKSIGLIKKVVNLSPEQAQAINENLIAAYSGDVETIEIPKEKEIENKKPEIKKMDLAKFKAEHSGVYQEAIQDATQKASEAAIAAERNRVKAWSVWAQVDPKKAMAGIESGNEITSAETQEFILASTKNGFKASLESEGEEGGTATTTEVDGKTKDQKETEKFEAGVRASLGLKS